MYLDYRIQKDFIGMDMCRKFLEMGFTQEDMLIIKMVISMIVMQVNHKKKIGQQVKKQSLLEDLKSLEI